MFLVYLLFEIQVLCLALQGIFLESWPGTHFGDIWLFLDKCQNQANDKQVEV